MQVTLPGVLYDIRGEDIQNIEIVNSMPMLPKTQLTIRGNRMVGGGLAQQLTVKKAVNSSDIVANFYKNFCMSKVNLSTMLPEV